MMSAPPTTVPGPHDSPRTSTPSSAPTSGSRFKKTPAREAGTRATPQFHSAYVAAEHPRPKTSTDAQPSGVRSSRGTPSHSRATGASANVPKVRIQAVADTAGYPSLRRLPRSTHPTTASKERSTSASPSQSLEAPGLATASATPMVDAPSAAHTILPSLSPRKRWAKNATIGGPQPTIRAATVAPVSESPQNCTRKVAGTVKNPTSKNRGRSRRPGHTPLSNA